MCLLAIDLKCKSNGASYVNSTYTIPLRKARGDIRVFRCFILGIFSRDGLN